MRELSRGRKEWFLYSHKGKWLCWNRNPAVSILPQDEIAWAGWSALSTGAPCSNVTQVCPCVRGCLRAQQPSSRETGPNRGWSVARVSPRATWLTLGAQKWSEWPWGNPGPVGQGALSEETEECIQFLLWDKLQCDEKVTLPSDKGDRVPLLTACSRASSSVAAAEALASPVFPFEIGWRACAGIY